ncbi:MAG: permease [Verrucomicrobiales bacterium]|nr:permease [Verrucomicrobiales bacterium]
MNDLRFAIRQLFKRPGFTLVAVLTLALGIGANTSMFSVLNSLLLRALPYPDEDRLVRIFRTSPQSKVWPHSAANYIDYRDQNTVFEQFAAFTWWNFNLSEPGGKAERLKGLIATAEFFPALGIQPAIGRVFNTTETEPGHQNVAVLSHGFWKRRFGGDRGIVGRTIRLDDEIVTIIGVMPPQMEQSSAASWSTVDVWLPLAFSASQRTSRGDNWLQEMGRLKPGISLARAQASMDVLAKKLEKDYPQNNSRTGMRLMPLANSSTDDGSRRLLWMSFGLTMLVLLIACANIANLLLTRAAGRVREFALRAALGARKGQLIRQLLTESLLLSFLGGGFGLLFAFWCNNILQSRLAHNIGDNSFRLHLDLRVLLFALFSSVVTGILFGLVPTLLASRTSMNAALKESARGGTAGRSQHRLRDALIIGEIALALTLLTGAGLFIRGLSRFTMSNPGWKVDGLLIAQLALTGPNYNSDDQLSAFYSRLEEKVHALPGVENVALSRSLPIWAFGSSRGIALEGQPDPQLGQEPVAFFEAVTPGYFDTLKIKILDGHGFSRQSDTNRPAVILINKTMSRRLWPNENAIGKRIGNGNPNNREWKEIVGIVDDLQFPANMSTPETAFQVYCPLSTEARRYLVLHVRVHGRPELIAPDLQRVVAGIDPDIPIYEVETARACVDRILYNARLIGQILIAFAILGLLLAAIGIYGVVSYSVVQRVSEVGIRMALGAQRRDVLRLILNHGFSLSLAGSVIGVVGSFGVAELLASVTPELPTRDPLTGIIMTIFLMAVVLFASWIPAYRASRLDPILALRYE